MRCVQVMDKNDNTPEFSFPSAHNSTVHLSSYAPRGHVVVHVTAHDLDAGDKLNEGHISQVNVVEMLYQVTTAMIAPRSRLHVL